jgi:transcriptional regulator with XRE-family HTH domain
LVEEIAMAKTRTRPLLVGHLAANLKAFRTTRGLTQEDVAEKCDLSVAYISLLERSGRIAPLSTVERLANAMGVEPHTLLVPPGPRNGKVATS